MEQFFAANDIEEAKKAPVYLATIGPKAFQTLSNLVAPRKPGEVTYSRSVESMSEFYNPKPLVTVQRYRFYSRFKKPDESISTFVAELRNLARDCAFGTTLETNLRDRLVCGIRDQALQRELLSEKDLTYERALEIALSHESATKNVAALHSSSGSTGETLYQVRALEIALSHESATKNVAALHSSSGSTGETLYQVRALEIALSHESATKNVAALHSSSGSTGETLYQVKGSATRSSSSSSTTCYRCGRRGHEQSHCKFKSATCHHCGKIGHIGPVCHSLLSSHRSSSTPILSSTISSAIISSLRLIFAEFSLPSLIVTDNGPNHCKFKSATCHHCGKIGHIKPVLSFVTIVSPFIINANIVFYHFIRYHFIPTSHFRQIRSSVAHRH